MFIAATCLSASEQKLQAQRMEQLESEKQRIEFDLRFSQRRLAASMGRAARSPTPSWDVPSEVADGLLRDADDAAAAPTVGTGCGFRLGDRTLEPVTGHFSRCGASTVGSDSEIGAILDPDEVDADNEGRPLLDAVTDAHDHEEQTQVVATLMRRRQTDIFF